jgi:hypothetical protein
MPTPDLNHLPQPDVNQFTCPNCNVVAQQHWSGLRFVNDSPTGQSNTVFVASFQPRGVTYRLSGCQVCSKVALWREGILVWPVPNHITSPSPDMPEGVKTDYEEARAIYNLSPKGAAALLRLAIQKLCVHLGGTGENINADIGKLVKDGLSVKVQQALDVVRVIGNNAVHPGQIAIDDNPSVVSALFRLVNIVVEDMITQPAQVAKMFNALPTGQKAQIEKRDS